MFGFYPFAAAPFSSLLEGAIALSASDALVFSDSASSVLVGVSTASDTLTLTDTAAGGFLAVLSASDTLSLSQSGTDSKGDFSKSSLCSCCSSWRNTCGFERRYSYMGRCSSPRRKHAPCWLK